jgi:hypothetical protein
MWIPFWVPHARPSTAIPLMAMNVAMTLIVSEVPGGVDSVAARRCSARMVIGAAEVPERLMFSVRGSAYAPSASEITSPGPAVLTAT